MTSDDLYFMKCRLKAEKQGQLLDSLQSLGFSGADIDFLLSVDRDKLKSAYRKMALRHHPDRAEDDAQTRQMHEAFVKVQTANDLLARFIESREQFLTARQQRQPDRDVPLQEGKKSGPTIIAVGGAKGGVGKSVLSSSLSIALAAMGKRVLAVDLDLGGFNMHLMFGVKTLDHVINEFLIGSASRLSSLETPTCYRNLTLLGGAGHQLGSANISYQRKLRLISHLRAAPHDLIVCDLGAGTNYNTLDFFLAADEHVVVTTNEPSAVLDAYALIKTALFRRMAANLKALRNQTPDYQRIHDFLHGKDNGPDAKKSLRDLIAELTVAQPSLASLLSRWVSEFRVRLVINQSTRQMDQNLFMRIVQVANKNIGELDIRFSHVPYDQQVSGAIARLTPFLALHPTARAAESVMKLAAALIQEPSAPAVQTMYRNLTATRRQVAGVLKDQSFTRSPVDFTQFYA